MAFSVAIPLTDSSQVGVARRRAAEYALALKFDETQAGKLSIVATEMANNVIKHAHRGQLVIQPFTQGKDGGLDLLALDKGPGMANIGECLRDGYSTAGSPGTGLGAIQRLSNSFDIYSQLNAGTAVLARLSPRPVVLHNGPVLAGAVCVPMTGEDRSGDAFAILPLRGGELVVVADGLGHGPHAAHAAEEALRVTREQAHRSPGEIIRIMQNALRSTRGASVAIAQVSFEKQVVRYAGVGNIVASISTAATSRSLISHNGTVGHELHRVQEFVHDWTKDSLLIMHSDGLQTRWQLESYPGLRFRHPSLIAGVLYRDFERGRDDVTVLSMREGG